MSYRVQRQLVNDNYFWAMDYLLLSLSLSHTVETLINVVIAQI